MAHLNIEFKAKVPSNDACEVELLKHHPRFAGEDHQTDTYFNTLNGRLKLREGRIENALIHYSRENKAGAKSSDVILYPVPPGSSLKELLSNAMGIRVIVDKKRKIYFIENVKFHFDQVEGLGNFLEVEAIDIDGSIGREKLEQQCKYYAELFGITEEDYLEYSYSDMLSAASS